MSHEQAKIPATLISGDGIGPRLWMLLLRLSTLSEARRGGIGDTAVWPESSVGATRYPRRPWMVSDEHASRLKGHLPPRWRWISLVECAFARGV